MKRAKPLPTPQKEFGFTRDTFNLFQECTTDGERTSHEISHFPTLGKTAVYDPSGGKFYDDKTVQTLVYADFVAKDK